MHSQRQEPTPRQKLYVLCGLCIALVIVVTILYRLPATEEFSQQPVGKSIKTSEAKRKSKSERLPAFVRPTKEETRQRYQDASAATRYLASRMKLLSLAAVQFSLDHNDKFAFNDKDFLEKLVPYGWLEKNRHEIIHPNGSKKLPFCFNYRLGGVNRDKFLKEEPIASWTTVVFYEGHNGKLDFAHKGYALVSFVPGQVWLVNKKEAKSLRWIVPAKFKN